MDRLRAPGTQGASGGGLTALGWLYVDTGRWDEALEAAAEAADLAEANQMRMVAASADAITATVLALRADPGAARAARGTRAGRGGPGRKRADRRPGLAGPGRGGARRGRHLLAFTQLRRLFSEEGVPVHNIFSYLGVADIATAAVRADRRAEGRDILERALGQLGGTRVSPAGPAHRPGPRHPRGPGPARAPISPPRSPTPPATNGRSSAPSSAWTTPNGCGGGAGSTRPSRNW